MRETTRVQRIAVAAIPVPLTQCWLGFEDAAIDIDPGSGTFTAELLVPGPSVDGAVITGFAGRWLVSERLIAPRSRAYRAVTRVLIRAPGHQVSLPGGLVQQVQRVGRVVDEVDTAAIRCHG